MNISFELPTNRSESALRPPVTIGPAESTDHVAAMSMLVAANLPLEGFVEHLGHVLVARDAAGALVGLVGLECYGRAALIRSAVVAPGHRRSGIGRRLLGAIIARAKGEGVATLYLLTESARPFFESMGFEAIARAAVDPQVRASAQFRGTPCRAATCLTRNI